MSDTEGYDEVFLVDGSKRTRLSKDQFKRMPLGERVKRILEQGVEFRLRGVVVDSHSALSAGG